MAKYRYPGTKSYSFEDEHIFFGRERDREKIYQLIGLEKLILIYGKSGVGKTSLLNAGLKPKLQSKGNYRFYDFRFFAYSEENTISPLQKIVDILKLGGNSQSFLDELAPNEHSLWLLLKKIQWENLQNEKKPNLVLIFDQFEELFTYSLADISRFKNQLSDVLFSSIPQGIRTNLENILDKDEDAFSDEELNFISSPLSIKILLIIRSDRMSLLNQLKDNIPNILTNIYELAPLDKDETKMAITEPAKEDGFISSKFDYSNDAISTIWNKLSNNNKNKVDSFQLQIVCRHCEELIIQKEQEGKDLIIEDADVSNIEELFETYYYNQLATLSPEEQKKAQSLIEERLIINGFRVPLSDKVIENEKLASEETLQKLVDKRLIQRQENTVGGYSYELSHDTLITPIGKAKALRKEKESQEKAEKDRLEEEQRLREQAKLEKEEKEKIKKQLQTTRNLLIFAIVALLMAIGGIVFAVYEQQKTEEQRDIALKAEENYKKQKGTADSLRTEAIKEARKSDSLRKIAEKALKDLEKQLDITKVEQKRREDAEEARRINKEESDLKTEFERIDRLPKPEIKKGIEDLEQFLKKNKYPNHIQKIKQKINELRKRL
jgi:hypothetical protein